MYIIMEFWGGGGIPVRPPPLYATLILSAIIPTTLVCLLFTLPSLLTSSIFFSCFLYLYIMALEWPCELIIFGCCGCSTGRLCLRDLCCQWVGSLDVLLEGLEVSLC